MDTDASHACPECGVVPSRFIDGDHNEGCSRQPICPECGCDPTTMFHGINGCSLAPKYVPTTVRALLRQAGVPHDAPAADQADAIRTWLATHKPSPMMEHSIRDHGHGHLLDNGHGG